MPTFRELRIEDLREEIQPDLLGRRAGDRGEPAPSAAEDPAQNQIVERIEALKREADETLVGQSDQARKHWDQLEQSEPESDLDAAVQSARTQFNEVAQRERHSLNDSRMEYRKLTDEFFDFRERNGLERQPAEPTAGWKALYLSVLFAIFLIESIFNASLLAVGSETGVFGGYLTAFIFSLINVLTPFLGFGNVFRWVHHVAIVKKILAWLSFMVYVPFAVTLNLGLAQFREASADLSEDVGVEAVSRFLQSPFGLSDGESWLLFAMGVFFSVVAFFEGYKFRDPYPGYGKKEKKMRDARNAYYDRRDRVVDQLADVREGSLDEIRQVLLAAMRRPKEQRRLLDGREALLASYREWLDQLQRLGVALVEEYREANRRARPDRRVPLVHQSNWRLSEEAEPPWVMAVPESVIEEELERLSQQRRAANEHVHALWDSVRRQIDPEGAEQDESEFRNPGLQAEPADASG